MKICQKDPTAEGRRKQLRRWIDENFNGSQVAFIASTNDGEKQINQGELSALLKDKSFGEKRARSLEKQAHMPPRYLDANLEVPATTYVREPLPSTGEYVTPMMRTPEKSWPFARVSRERLMNLKRHLGGRRGLDAIDDIDRTLEVMVLKWEQQIPARKSAAR